MRMVSQSIIKIGEDGGAKCVITFREADDGHCVSSYMRRVVTQNVLSHLGM